MGERLNIEIVKNKKLLANCYYHWSGFSNSAVNLTICIINNYDYVKKYKVGKVKNKDLLLAIRLLEETGAGTNESEKDNTIKRLGLIDENIQLKKCDGRNEGIIETSKEGMEETRGWEEERVTIDIENKTIEFNAIDKISKEDKEEYYNSEKFETINMNLKNISFEDIFDLKAFIDKASYRGQYLFYNEFDNQYINLIL